MSTDISFFMLKASGLKGRNTAQSIPARKKREPGEKEGKNGSNNPDAESISLFSSRASMTDDREELDLLKGQLEDLQRKLLEKDESLKSAEVLKNEMTAIHAELDELKIQTSEKESLIKSTQRQLADAKVFNCLLPKFFYNTSNFPSLFLSCKKTFGSYVLQLRIFLKKRVNKTAESLMLYVTVEFNTLNSTQC